MSFERAHVRVTPESHPGGGYETWRTFRMAFILWLIAVALVVAGIIWLLSGSIIGGIVLIVVGLLIGPGGVSVFHARA